MKIIANFFVRIGQWIKNTAWIQIIGIVGIVVGIIIAVPYAVRGIQGWVATFDESTFYVDHKIDYARYEQISTSQDNVIVFFYEETCSNCETNQKSIESFYNRYHNIDETRFTFYSIDIAWEDEENDNEITKDQLENVGLEYASVYRTQTDPKILGNYPDYNADEVKNLEDPYAFPTPTIVLIKDGGVSAVRLGFDSNTTDSVFDNLYYLLTGEDL